jgi:membrane-bound acyltransferase YfiQ involved in biofilm formation
MRNTIIMVAVIGTFIATACFLGFIGWCLSDLSYKQCMNHGGLHFLMLLFGWIPCFFVGKDIDDKLDQ